MKSLKNISIFLLMFVFCANLALAQGKGQGKGKGKGQTEASGQVGVSEKKSPEMRAKTRTEWMTKQLALSPQQQTDVYNVFLSSFTQIEDIKKVAKGEARQNRISIIKQNREARLKEILTPTQYATLEKIRAEKKAKGERDAEDDQQEDDEVKNNQNAPATQQDGPKNTQSTPKKGGSKK